MAKTAKGSSRTSNHQLTKRRKLRRPFTKSALLVGSAFVLVSCGSPSSTSANQTTQAPAKTSSSTTRSKTSSTTSVSSLLNLRRLESLTNYSFTYSFLNHGVGFTTTARVHSLTDWSLTSSSPKVTIYDINGHGFSVFDSIRSPETFKTPQGASHLAGEPTWARALIDDTHVSEARIVEGGNCHVAGLTGTEVTVRPPSASRAIFALTIHACIDTSSGALLSYTQGVIGGSSPTAVGLNGANEVWTLTSVGHVSTVHLPAVSASTTTSTTSPFSSPAPTIPSSFPSSVPVPPGRLLSATALSSSSWYLLLSESTKGGAAQYIKTLKSDGFTTTTSSSTAIISVAGLTNGTDSIEVEQTPASSGSGSVANLVITVTATS